MKLTSVPKPWSPDFYPITKFLWLGTRHDSSTYFQDNSFPIPCQNWALTSSSGGFPPSLLHTWALWAMGSGLSAVTCIRPSHSSLPSNQHLGVPPFQNHGTPYQYISSLTCLTLSWAEVWCSEERVSNHSLRQVAVVVFVQVFTSTRGQFTLLFLYKTCVHVEPKDSERLTGVWFVVVQIVCFEVTASFCLV